MGFFDNKINRFIRKAEEAVNRFNEDMVNGINSFSQEMTSQQKRMSGSAPVPPPLPESDTFLSDEEEETTSFVDQQPEAELPTAPSSPTAVDYLSPRMRGLINAAVRDGVVTREELAVLVRKGAEEGMDADEVVMVTNARLFEIRQSHKPSAPAAPPRRQRPEGKCPYCGAINPPGTRVCQECGKPLPASAMKPAATPPPISVSQLIAQVQKIRDDGDEHDIPENVIIARQREIIMSFPMPDTVNTLYSFIVTAIAEAEDDYDLESVWLERAKAAIAVLEVKHINTPGVREFIRERREEIEDF